MSQNCFLGIGNLCFLELVVSMMELPNQGKIIMSIQRRFYYSVAALAASITCVGAASSQAVAVDFVPQQQGEINVGLGCLEDCIELSPIFESIISLEDASSGTKSRLFVDYFGDGDIQETYGSGSSKVLFKTRDVGTTAEGFWFRPSERTALTDGSFGTEETGQLEVGTYQFNFARELAEITIDFFDTESWNTTGVIAINGQALASPDYVAKGKDGNIVSQTFTNVNSLVLKLGNDTVSGTGDGVDFRMSGVPTQDVPEPTMALGLMAIAGLGLASKKKAA